MKHINLHKKRQEEFEKKFPEIMGLETDPDGIPEMLLLRNEKGEIEHGIDFSEEKEQLKKFLTLSHIAIIEAEIEELQEEIDSNHIDYDLPYNQAKKEIRSKIAEL